MKKLLIPFLIICILAAGLSYYLYTTFYPQDPKSNWRLYTDTVNGYSFRYPQQAYPEILVTGNGITMYPYKVKSSSFLNPSKDTWIQTTRIPNAPLEAYISAIQKATHYETFTTSQTTFNTIPGYEINTVRTTGQGREYTYSFNTHVNNDIYIFTLLAANNDPLEKNKEQFRQILSTLVIK